MTEFNPEFQILKNVDQIKTLAAEWDRLADQFNSPLFAAAWFQACAQAFCKEGDLYIPVMRIKGKLCGIAPMKIVKKTGLKSYELIGTSDLYEPSGLIYETPDALVLLIRALLTKKIPIVLKRMESQSVIFEKIRKVCQYHAVVITRQSSNTLVFHADANYKNFEESLSVKTNRKIRRKTNQAKKFGKVEFDVISPTSKNLDNCLQELYTVEHSGWKARTGTSILLQPEMQIFLKKYAAACIKNNSLRMFVMRVNNKPAAIKMAVVHSNKLWEIKIGYDETYAKCSPGILLTHEALKYSFNEKYNGYEFLGEEEAWEHTWTKDRKSYSSVYIFPYSVSGVSMLTREIILLTIKKIKYFINFSQ